ncbi:MAG TPA: enolase C-terminal domain-like protein [Acidimicrobiales bacterium]|jgi:L-alanine-DL-glutamate epimerase-like enolase superfamily enzyme
MPDGDRCPVRSVACRSYTVPTDQPEADGTLQWDSTTAVVVEVSAGGVSGLGWTYASAACQPVIDDVLAHAVIGRDISSVAAAHEAMVRATRNLGRPGVVSCAISAVDIALWDGKARHLGVALADLVGRCTDQAPIYGSGGFTTYDDSTAGAQIEQWVGEWGIPRFKIKVGESWGSRPERDLARANFARRSGGDGVELLVDANGGYSRKQAIRMGRRFFDEAGVIWFEEPVSSDDLTGLKEVRDQLPLEVAAGEYGFDETYFAKMVAAGAVDCLQVDVTRCGGYTSWLRAAALAGANGLEVSAHCAPNLHAHVGVAVPNLRHIEYFHDHHRLEHLLFDGLLSPVGGFLRPASDAPGHGMTLKESDAAPYRR